MHSLDSIIDAIYEAGFVPELWPTVLDDIAELSGSACGELHVAGGAQMEPLGWKASPLTSDALDRFNRGRHWRGGEKPFRFLAKGHAGFLCDIDFLTPEEMVRDPFNQMLETLGLWWQTGSIITMPTGEHAAFTFERWQRDGPPGLEEIALLDSLRPHLARAGLIAARLRLERAKASLAGLDALGLAGAVLTGAGQVLCANAPFEAHTSRIIPLARGRMALSDSAAQAQFEMALSQLAARPVTCARSIALRGEDDTPPSVLHLIPLVREAHATFFGADLLVIVTPLRPDTPIPSLRLLHALFDLTAAECKLANELAGGRSLRDAADECGIAFSTARSYLETVFHKTGAHHQHELVALLKSVPPVDLGA
jgi:DNA-binding CsgD family transcriptional regulator